MIAKSLHTIDKLVAKPTFKNCTIQDSENGMNIISLQIRLNLQYELEKYFDENVPFNYNLKIDNLIIDLAEIRLEDLEKKYVPMVMEQVKAKFGKIVDENFKNISDCEYELMIEIQNNSLYFVNNKTNIIKKNIYYNSQYSHDSINISSKQIALENRPEALIIENIAEIDIKKNDFRYNPIEVPSIKITDLELVIHYLKFGSLPYGFITNSVFDFQKTLKNLIDFYPKQFSDAIQRSDNQKYIYDRLLNLDKNILEKIQINKLLLDEEFLDNFHEVDLNYGSIQNEDERNVYALIYFLNNGFLPWWSTEKKLNIVISKVIDSNPNFNIFKYNSQVIKHLNLILDTLSNDIVKKIVQVEYKSNYSIIENHRMVLSFWLQNNNNKNLSKDQIDKLAWSVIFQYIIEYPLFDNYDFILFTIKDITSQINIDPNQFITDIVNIREQSDNSIIKDWIDHIINIIEIKSIENESNISNLYFSKQITDSINSKRSFKYLLELLESEPQRFNEIKEYFSKYQLFQILDDENNNHSIIFNDIFKHFERKGFDLQSTLLQNYRSIGIENIDFSVFEEKITYEIKKENLTIQEELIINKFYDIKNEIDNLLNIKPQINNELSNDINTFLSILKIYETEDLLYVDNISLNQSKNIEDFILQVKLYIKYFLIYNECPWWMFDSSLKNFDSAIKILFEYHKVETFEYIKFIFQENPNKKQIAENFVKNLSDDNYSNLLLIDNENISEGINFIINFNKIFIEDKFYIFQLLFQKKYDDKYILILDWLQKFDLIWFENHQSDFENSIFINEFNDVFINKKSHQVESEILENQGDSIDIEDTINEKQIDLFVLFLQKGFIPIEKYLQNQSEFESLMMKVILLFPEKFRYSINRVGRHIIAEILPFQYFTSEFQQFILQFLDSSNFKIIDNWSNIFEKSNLIDVNIINNFKFVFIRDLAPEKLHIEIFLKELIQFSIRSRMILGNNLVVNLIDYFENIPGELNTDIVLKELKKIENQTVKHKALFSEIDKQNNIDEKLPIQQSIFIRNAGLILLWPFFIHYFKFNKLVDENNLFLSEDHAKRAVHLLQYLVNRSSDSPEIDLVFNKILCGLPINSIIPRNIEMSDKEIDIAESLLIACIKQWDALKNTTPDGLRNSFLIRDGFLTVDSEKNWTVKVEGKAWDILLTKLNWGLSMVKLSWMKGFIYIEWKKGAI